MSKRCKLILCSMLFLVGGVVNVLFSTPLHFILTKRLTVLKLIPVSECLQSLANDSQHFRLYICLQGFILILAIMLFLTNTQTYKSELETITPDIQTPKAVGQYQHGSARWLTDKEKDKVFSSFMLDESAVENKIDKNISTK